MPAHVQPRPAAGAGAAKSHCSGLECAHECVACRLGSLVEEVEEVLQGRGEAAVSWEEGYSAPLYARVHMRLGMWQWTVNSSEVGLLWRDEGPT